MRTYTLCTHNTEVSTRKDAQVKQSAGSVKLLPNIRVATYESLLAMQALSLLESVTLA